MSFLSKEDAIKVGKGMGCAALVVAVIYLTSLTGSLPLMILGGGLSCAGLAKISTGGSMKNLIGWAVIGAIAGFGFWAAL